MNAYYSLLNLKHASGIEITDAEKEATLNEVFERFGAIDKAVETLLDLPSSAP